MATNVNSFFWRKGGEQAKNAKQEGYLFHGSVSLRVCDKSKFINFETVKLKKMKQQIEKYICKPVNYSTRMKQVETEIKKQFRSVF